MEQARSKQPQRQSDSSLRARLQSQNRRRTHLGYERRSFSSHPKLVQDIRPAGTRQKYTVDPSNTVAHFPNRPPLRKVTGFPASNTISDIKPSTARRPKGSAAPTAATIHSHGHHHTRHLSTNQMRSQVLQRKQVKLSSMARTERKALKKHVALDKALLVCGILVIAGGLWLGWRSFTTNEKIAQTVQTLGEQTNDQPGTNSTVPSETNPPSVSSYKTAPDLPRAIRIEKIGVEARVLRLGVRANNQLGAPPNIFDAGWYEASSKPGEGGAVVIDGHVSGPTKPGVFHKLDKLATGDKITVERGDGNVISYTVVTKRTYPNDKVDMAAALVSITPGKNGLNLITCEGEVDHTGAHFKERLIVFAEQL